MSAPGNRRGHRAARRCQRRAAWLCAYIAGELRASMAIASEIAVINGAAHAPGLYRTDRTPYSREPLDVLEGRTLDRLKDAINVAAPGTVVNFRPPMSKSEKELEVLFFEAHVAYMHGYGIGEVRGADVTRGGITLGPVTHVHADGHTETELP